MTQLPRTGDPRVRLSAGGRRLARGRHARACDRVSETCRSARGLDDRVRAPRPRPHRAQVCPTGTSDATRALWLLVVPTRCHCTRGCPTGTAGSEAHRIRVSTAIVTREDSAVAPTTEVWAHGHGVPGATELAWTVRRDRVHMSACEPGRRCRRPRCQPRDATWSDSANVAPRWVITVRFCVALVMPT